MNKKKNLLLFLTIFALSGCAKTNLLYRENEYNSPVFDENYYVEWDGIKELDLDYKLIGSYKYLSYSSDNKITLGGQEITDYTWFGDESEQFGYNHNLSKIEKKFSYGIMSKLFDGRVRCDKLYQKSRVQLDKSGFAMFFPKSLMSAKFLGFACRGGSDYPDGQFSHSDLKVNFSWAFYIHEDDGKYGKITYNLENVQIPVDNGGNTAFVNFVPPGENFDILNRAVAMSFEWTCVDSRLPLDLTDDYTQKEKHHLSLMLYEVFIGDSVWY